jgi:hypothetical protein
MKKYKIFIVLLFPLLFLNCTEEDLDFVLGIENNYTYDVAGESTFKETYTVTDAELIDMVIDIDSELRNNVSRLDIEKVKVKLVGKTGNTTKGIRLNVSILLEGDSKPSPLFEDFPISVTTEKEDYTNVTALSENTVKLLAAKLKAVAKDEDYSSFEVIADGIIEPGMLNAELKIVIQASMVSSSTMEMIRL